MQTQSEEIIWIINQFPSGTTCETLLELLRIPPSKRSLQRHLKKLLDDNKIKKQGIGRSTKYVTVTPIDAEAPEITSKDSYDHFIPLSEEAKEIQAYIRQPIGIRKSVSFTPTLIADYEPGKTFYLNRTTRKRLKQISETGFDALPAGTFARSIRERFLNDLSWASSRLKDNAYSRLDVQRLITQGQMATSKRVTDAQMILNHKRALEFLLDDSEHVGFNRYTFLNLHGTLSENLISDPAASGRLRFRDVEMIHSKYQPTNVPQLIEVMFDVILSKAEEIPDPFEQALFIMAQIPYLQPFEEGNQRVARLGANVSLIRQNLCPLTFVDLPRDAFREAVLGVIELSRIELLRDIFIWSYERSAGQYIRTRGGLVQPDPIRLKYRKELHEILRFVVCKKKIPATPTLEEYAKSHIETADQTTFVETAIDDLTLMHEGVIARYQIRPSEFEQWRQARQYR